MSSSVLGVAGADAAPGSLSFMSRSMSCCFGAGMGSAPESQLFTVPLDRPTAAARSWRVRPVRLSQAFISSLVSMSPF